MPVRGLEPVRKVEADISDRHVDVVEVRPPWDGVGEHTRFPTARLGYAKPTGLWVMEERLVDCRYNGG